MLDAGDAATDVRAVFSWSYNTLTTRAAQLFRQLGLHPGPDIDTTAVASLTGLPLRQVRTLLTELIRAHLVTEPVAGRYAFHDLLRAYATDLTHTQDTDDVRHATQHRMLDHYLHTADSADWLLYPHRDRIEIVPCQPGVVPEDLTEPAQALVWFTRESRVLLAAVDHAANTGFGTYAWKLAWSLVTFFERRGYRHEWVTSQTIGLRAAEQINDLPGQAHCSRDLGIAYLWLGRYDDARMHLGRAFELFGELGDTAGRALVQISLSIVAERQGQYADGLYHAEQALSLYEAADHRAGQANALNNIGWLQIMAGDHHEALTYCQRALTMEQEINDRYGEAASWDSLGYVNHHLGDYQQATMCYQHALDLFEELGDRYSEADTLTNLGDTYRASGDTTSARAAWQHALDILEELDHPNAEEIRTKLHDLDR